MTLIKKAVEIIFGVGENTGKQHFSPFSEVLSISITTDFYFFCLVQILHKWKQDCLWLNLNMDKPNMS